MRTVFLKLGGSLITDKRQPETPRLETLDRLAAEIASALREDSELRLVIGHGSGSFGHVYGQRYGTRGGVRTAEDWFGYAETGDAAARLNRLVVRALLGAGIAAWSIQPGAVAQCRDGVLEAGPEAMVTAALESGLTPVVFGDVALDVVRGGTIVSTEELFEWMLPRMPETFGPQRLVLAGEVDGIFTADPQVTDEAVVISELTPDTVASVAAGLGASHGMDVTGGMEAKVSQAMRMVQANPTMDVIVCSGMTPGAVLTALQAAESVPGTRIHA